MKTQLQYFFLILFLPLFTTAQVLEIDGNQPGPFLDRSGNHQVDVMGAPEDSAGVLVFPSETLTHNYLKIDTLIPGFEVNGNWTVEFKVYAIVNNEDFFFLDWGSSSLTGHMRFAYIHGRGVHFSDRPVNGQSGQILIDTLPLPVNTWTSYKFEKTGTAYTMYRNGTIVNTNSLPDTLTEPTVTTIGYSEDDRPFHRYFCLDDVKINGTITAGLAESVQDRNTGFRVSGNWLYVSNSGSNTVPLSLYSLTGQLVQRIYVSPGNSAHQLNAGKGMYIVEFGNRSAKVSLSE